MKYFVKKHCEADELLNISTRTTQDYYYGKHPIGAHINRDFEPRPFEAEQYGFNSIEEAKPLFVKMLQRAEEENKEGHWKVTVEIVEVN